MQQATHIYMYMHKHWQIIMVLLWSEQFLNGTSAQCHQSLDSKE